MSFFLHPTINRRELLTGSASVAAALLTRPAHAVANTTNEFSLTAAPGRAPIVGEPHPATDVWCFGNRVPGPEIRVRQGERLRVVVANRLPEDTTVHWHGIRLPNAMDGVPGLTQPPIGAGESFTYEFTPPDAGTFWYHPHADTEQQLGRGLAGALIVEEREPIPVDRDLRWFIEDWRLDETGKIVAGFGNGMEA